MANILKRFGDIMSANINALLDKAEDPEKMIDEYMRKVSDDLAKVKSETASVMASETKAKRDLDDCTAEIESMQKYAEKAVLAGNDGDARAFLENKASLEKKREGLEQAYNLAAENSRKMREMHDKLSNDLKDLQSRRDSIRAKMAVAKTQERLNEIDSTMSNAGQAMTAFDRMEEKANRRLDEANAMSSLNKPGNTIDDLTDKYDISSSSVDDELAALKAKLGV